MRARPVPILSAAVCIAVLALQGTGCGESSGGSPDAGTSDQCPVSAPPTCPTPLPVYADVKPIFEQRCVICHSGQPGGPWTLDSYTHVSDWQDAVAQMVGDCEMPPPSANVPMTVEEREAILSWIQCGARP